MKIPDDINKTDIIVAIEEWVLGRNAERNKEILHKTLILGRTFEKVADEYLMSPRQIKNIVYKWGKTIFKHIRK